ncbi:MAG: DUF1588 domain-containing protein [Alphaproteobacteria bacterium]|nr:DUF1588 domain-containing protein [Alphaproteobacteria bacterium]
MRRAGPTRRTTLSLVLLGACGLPSDVPDEGDDTAPPADEVAEPLVPGVPLRRLTRAEIERSLEALYGLDLDLRTRLPDDDLVEGLDNQASGLTVPELLLEQLDRLALELAREATARVARPTDVQRVEVEDVPPATGVAVELPSAEGTWWLLWGRAAPVELTVQAPADGTYALRVPAFSTWGPGVAQADLELRVDGVTQGVRTARGSQEAPDHVTWPLALTAGSHAVSLRLRNGSLSSGVAEDGSSVELGEVGVGLDAVELRGPLAADEGAPGALRARLVPCDPEEPRAQVACAEQVLADLAPRAWRRPVTSPEVQALVRLVEAAMDGGATWDDGLATALHALVLSPHFLFRVERGEGPVDAGTRALTPHELATRLSYLLWAEPPDAALRACADAGALVLPEGDCGLAAQVDRLLADARATALVERFGRPWLDVADPARAQPATDAFLEALLLGDAPLEAVVTGEGMDAAVADPSRPGGALALPEVLRATSEGDRTSVVARGVLVAARLLCDPPDPPPREVPMLEPGDNALAALDAHRANPACASCHQGFDPYGEALEAYGPDGQVRTAYADGAPVPARATLPDGSEVAGAEGLADWLAANPALRACVTSQVGRYAWGVPLGEAGGLLHALQVEGRDRGGSMADLLRAVALHPAFRRLRVAGEAP